MNVPKASPAEVRRQIILDITEQQRRDRIRALDIAICVMEEQGYHGQFLQELRDELYQCSIVLNGRTWTPYTAPNGFGRQNGS